MSSESGSSRSPSSAAHDAFQLAFETADAFSLIWQPFLKTCGRFQLEMAQAGAKQGRATIEFNHRLVQATNPIDLLNAQVVFWKQVGQAYSEASQHMTGAFAGPAEPQAAIDFVPVPKSRKHDTLRLDDPAKHRNYEPERKVA